MITENEIIEDLDNLSMKLNVLIKNRRNNIEFWTDVRNKIDSVIKELKSDKRIYGW